MPFFRVREDGSPSVEASPLSVASFNSHVLLCGVSGSGKSYFASRLFPHPDGLLLFKPDTIFRGVPKAVFSGLPDPFTFVPHEVVDAYLYSLHLDFSGIMASSLVPVLFAALSRARRSKNPFSAFYRDLDSYSGLEASVASLVRSHFDFFFPGQKVSRRSSRFKVSFEGLPSMAAEFGAELLLRSLYSGLSGVIGTVLIDEFHHVARERSILDTLLREARVAGRIVGITQSLSDVAPSMLANFGYVLVGNSIHPGDLAYLGSFYPDLQRLVFSLPPRVFLSLREYLSAPKGVPPLYAWLDD